MKLNPYLNFNGNCKAAFHFYEEHLGGKIAAMMTHAEAPAALNTPENWRSAILHARIEIGGTELMGSDVPTNHFEQIHSSYLSLTVDSPEEAEQKFAILTHDGQVFMPLQETFWAFRFGILRDRFGILWMISAERPMPRSE